MNGLDRFGEWAAALLVATSTWLAGLAVSDTGTTQPVVAPAAIPISLSWAQDATDVPIQATEADDVETLDNGTLAADAEALDQAPQDTVQTDPTGQEDVELLDQGAPPVAAPASVESIPAATEPVPVQTATTSTDSTGDLTTAASEPPLPPGFGSGRVHVAAGSSGFPVGLENCHVGAVTGRAYVGIGCGENDMFVGHAPTFDEFPFVVDAAFPFDTASETPVLPSNAATDASDTVLVSSNTGSRRFLDDAPAAPEVSTDGAASVTLAQRARDQAPRVRVERENGSDRSRSSTSRKKSDAKAQRADDSGGGVESESRKKESAHGGNGHGDGKDKHKKRDKDKKKKKGKRSNHKR